MDDTVTELRRRALRGLASFLALLALLLFAPAWSLRYWQGFVYWLVFSAATSATSLYFIEHDPALVARRMRIGPVAEKETSQKIIQAAASVCFILLIVVPALDHRFGWSRVPPAIAILGDLGVAAGFLIVFLVLKENSYASSTIEINEGQRVVASGPYAIVRHPMYAGAAVMLSFTPLALGSWWGLLLAVPMIAVLVWRLLDEERFLLANLPGYADYCRAVRDRLVPLVW